MTPSFTSFCNASSVLLVGFRSYTSCGSLLGANHHTLEERVPSIITGEFRMEGSREEIALPHSDGHFLHGRIDALHHDARAVR